MTVPTWYHVSRNWDFDQQTVYPAMMRIDDEADPQDRVPFIAVCPTVAQCLVALGELSDCLGGQLSVYAAKGNPSPSTWVFDYSITEEHRFHKETVFTHVGDINQSAVVEACGLNLRPQAGQGIENILKILSNNLTVLQNTDLLKA